MSFRKVGRKSLGTGMATEQYLLDDIITDHRERMLNIKKYYPFFELARISFENVCGGKYPGLDMGYITMAVIRFFIEENNFKDKDVTYPEYIEFMTKCLSRDFGLNLFKEESKEVADFVFDKIRNDGRPFVFEYFDPVDKKKRSLRLRIINSRVADNTVWYQITSDAIEFYLDTKEIKDESKINVEQLLLEKLIESKDFRGGIEVVRRINSEVDRLKLKKDEVAIAIAEDVSSGLKQYEQFVDTGMKWFDDEQRLFVKNTRLIENALRKAEEDYKSLSTEQLKKSAGEIYELETELKIAMNKHAQLLKACTDLSIMADAIIAKTKLSKLRSRFDFKANLSKLIKLDDAALLYNLVSPVFGINTRKSFNIAGIEELLSYPKLREEEKEIVAETRQEDIVFEDEIADKRIHDNYCDLMKILFALLKANKEFDLNVYNDAVKRVLGTEVFKNGDYYSFLVNLCQKKCYEVSDNMELETFLDAILSDIKFENAVSFELELSEGNVEDISIEDIAYITNIRFRAVEVSH